MRILIWITIVLAFARSHVLAQEKKDAAALNEHNTQLVTTLSGCSGRFLLFSADGNRILTADHHHARLWDLELKKQIGADIGNADTLVDIALNETATAAMLVSASEVVIWTFEPARETRRFKHPTDVLS